MKLIETLIEKDPVRQQALKCLQVLNLPQGYLAAGFVRNLVWDHLHQKTTPTSLNDVDVIYFDLDEADANNCFAYEKVLTESMPSLNWQVRNQAKMHLRNGDAPYTDVVDAMSYWPEKETAVAVRLAPDNALECVSAFGFDSLLALYITPNPKRDIALFRHRIESKQWLTTWPKLQLQDM